MINDTACEEFDTGRYNDIIFAYMVLVMQDLNLPSKTRTNMLGALHSRLDDTCAAEAIRKTSR